jgi:hypothetical protein
VVSSRVPSCRSVGSGRIEKLATTLRKLADAERNSGLAKAIRIEAEYFDSNRDRMRYPEFRKKESIYRLRRN